MVAPATREVPAESSADVARFASALLESRLDLVIFLTGVGTRALARAIEPFCSREQFVSTLSKVPILARGPKPVAALQRTGRAHPLERAGAEHVAGNSSGSRWQQSPSAGPTRRGAGVRHCQQGSGAGSRRAGGRGSRCSRLRLGSAGRHYAAAGGDRGRARGKGRCRFVYGGDPGTSPAAGGGREKMQRGSSGRARKDQSGFDRAGDFGSAPANMGSRCAWSPLILKMGFLVREAAELKAQ